MKIIYVMFFLLAVFMLTGCSRMQKTPEISKDDTSEIQIEKKIDLEILNSETEKNTGVIGGIASGVFDSGFDSGDVLLIKGSNVSRTGNTIFDEVNKLIQERNTKAKDAAKLTEEDIELLENIIEKIKEEIKKK